MLKSYLSNYMGLPKACWQGIVLTFFNAMSVGICFFLTLYFVNELHIDVIKSGLIISCYGLGTVLGGLIGGRLSDLFSPRLISIISLFIQASAFLLLTKLTQVNLLMPTMFLLGIASYGFKIANNVWVLSHCAPHSQARFQTISISHVASNLGLGISGIVIGLFTNHGFDSVLLGSAGILFLSAIYLSCKSDHANAIVSHHQAEEIKSISLNHRQNKIMFVVLSCVFLIGLIIAQLSATYPLYVQQAFPTLGVKAVSILFILDTVLIVVFQAPLSGLMSQKNKMMVVGVGAFLMGLGMLVLSFSFSFMLAIISCVIWTTGEMLFISTAQLVCYENGGEKKKGQSLGVFQASFAASSVIGPFLGGAVYQQFGGHVLWYLSFVIGTMCCFACLYYRSTYADASA